MECVTGGETQRVRVVRDRAVAASGSEGMGNQRELGEIATRREIISPSPSARKDQSAPGVDRRRRDRRGEGGWSSGLARIAAVDWEYGFDRGWGD